MSRRSAPAVAPSPASSARGTSAARARWGAALSLIAGLGIAAAAPARAAEGIRVEAPAAPEGLSGAAEGARGAALAPRLDDVFGDALAMQRTIDRSLMLAVSLRRLSDDFARAVQDTLGEISRTGAGACPASASRPFGRAHRLGLEYLRVGRELARHHAQVQDGSQLGDGAGLTPDYRARMQKVLTDYEGLLADYREMKAAFHGQLGDELRFAGCDTAVLLAQGATPAGEAAAATWERSAGFEPEPRSAPTPVAAAAPSPPRLALGVPFYIDNSRCRRDHRLWVDGALVGLVKGGQREVFRTTAGPHELCLLTEGAGASAPARTDAVAASSVGRSTSLGVPVAHASESQALPIGCGAPGTVRRGYIHEGWTIALRCE